MIFASNNQGKIKQIKELFKDKKIYGLKEYGIEIDVVEDGETFAENAIKKAKEIHDLTNEAVLADDSGLCIEAFEGWPGVYTHRFLGVDVTARERNLHILGKMKDIPYEKRDASFVCNFAFCDKNGKITVFEGVMKSKIAFEPKGENGFGFDEILECQKGKTCAELKDEEKLKINARGLAFQKMQEAIKNGLFVE